MSAGAAHPLAVLLGGDGETADLAARYLRIGAAGLPMALIALAGQGYERGVGDLRTPLVVVGLAQGANVVLELIFVYGLDWGLDGSAAGTVVAQAGMGAAFAWPLLRAPARSRRPQVPLLRPLLRVSGELFIRSAALLGAFATASAVLARVGEASLAAHQIAFQLFIFSALVLGAMLLAGLGVYAPIALLALELDWGIAGVWAGLLAMMGVRLLTLGARFVSRRWAVPGAVAARGRGRASPAR